MFKNDVAIIGGLGHVGLPFGIALADKGLSVCLIDRDEQKIQQVSRGEMPFIEYGAEPLLHKALRQKKLSFSSRLADIMDAEYVVITIGTPVDEYLNPKLSTFIKLIEQLRPYFKESQTMIIRSTVYPETCERALQILGKGNWKLAYCPERIAQGYAIEELTKLPQIVAGLSEEANQNAERLFAKLSPKTIRTSVGEAVLAKLYSNAWRYIKFAVANQFYMIADSMGHDYEKIRVAMADGYKRNADLPSAGFAAGPCLLKDTMQLCSAHGYNFPVGEAARLVNEGLPNYIVEKLRKKHDLNGKRVGILGMAFKKDVDDTRDSLSFKLGKLLRFFGAQTYYSDEFAKGPDFITKEELINKSEIIIVGVPHSAYRQVVIPRNKDVIDIWNVIRQQPATTKFAEEPCSTLLEGERNL